MTKYRYEDDDDYEDDTELNRWDDWEDYDDWPYHWDYEDEYIDKLPRGIRVGDTIIGYAGEAEITGVVVQVSGQKAKVETKWGILSVPLHSARCYLELDDFDD